MNRFAFYAYYDGTPTSGDPLRLTKSDDEIRRSLTALPDCLESRCSPGTKIKAAMIEMREVEGALRLTRLVSVETVDNELKAIKQIELAFNDLHLFGQRA
ncbi:hypothetical protein [Burkholderia sp. PAMC 26561]|uniref:hypothetical protein n=1 Tax=Burkholderia sp. PAMC 26561 TaxID=1795043 RepID=UPI000B0ED6E6|nr:hypothetical protein [Burkholderia sp. PAMC 26561]